MYRKGSREKRIQEVHGKGIHRIRRKAAVFLAGILLAGTLGACAGQTGGAPGEAEDVSSGEQSGTPLGENEGTGGGAAGAENAAGADSVTGADDAADTGGADSPAGADGAKAGNRPQLFAGSGAAVSEELGITPCVEPYTVESDLSNIDNLWQFYLDDTVKKKLAENGFVVFGRGEREFFQIYELDRYEQIAHFVTVDSLMHTYHLYFSYLLKNIEKTYLSENIRQLSGRMLADSAAQYEKLKGSEWENAAKRNVAFFNVGMKLLDDSTVINNDAAELVQYELDCIGKADTIYESAITGEMEDYTQYIPRGYYEGDQELERYFKAMMWYGRIHFEQRNEELDRSALLISQALLEDEEAYGLWESFYAVTSFFAGASDDLGVCEYAPVIAEAYGEDMKVEDLAGNAEAFARFHEKTGTLTPPQINSVPIGDGEDNVILGFRFMGQRFTIDGAVMQKLIYSAVRENGNGDKRMLPDVLDVPAALGSDLALRILEEDGTAEYAGYSENMSKLRETLSQENKELWSASLYAGWLHTLRPLLEAKGEGYPMFMQSEEWQKKDLECFAGSFTELKHDTILYAKQVIAEMGGGGYEQEPDDRGYVEPEPVVYARFVDLTDKTAQGLKRYGMLSSAEEENLTRLSQIAGQLLEISRKELQDEVLTDEEYDFIRNYGGNIEHFWYEAAKAASGSTEGVEVQEFPAAVVVDIATNPNGEVLEAATDVPSLLYVIVKVDGKLKIARGSVYSFYQFSWPMEDRLTDTKWRQMIGVMQDEDGMYNQDMPVQKPEWTKSYWWDYAE